MADSTNPWNILMGYMGIPQPSLPPGSSQNSLGSDPGPAPFPIDATGGKFLALPVTQSPAPANATVQSTIDRIPRNPGVPLPAGDVMQMLRCMVQANPNIVSRITSTSEPYPGHGQGDPHYTNQAMDIATIDPVAAMRLAAACGAQYQQNEYSDPSKNSNGGHVHLQTRPGLGGATGPYYPPPRPIPRPDS